MWPDFIRDYKKIEKPIILCILAELCIQLVNATFLNIQPLYMSRENFSDEAIAGFISMRYLGVVILAVPLGLFIHGKKVKSLFYISALGVPLFALFIIYFVNTHNETGIYISQFFWGASFTFMQIPIIPFILRNSKKENHTGGIALSYSTWSFAGIISGIAITLLDGINAIYFDEKTVLLIFSIVGFAGILFLYKANISEKTVEEKHKVKNFRSYDWIIIAKSLIPTLIIAVGAGLTIPFISLFFEKVHQLDKGEFSIISSIASVLVAWGALMVPRIKKKIGYKIAIPTTQSLAVVSLVALATTQFYNQFSIAVFIAIICYLLRQPLMNLAGPMTSELVMNYVGKRNQEIVSSLTSAIWSGSWFVSGLMVKLMFSKGYSFVNVFLITSALYAIGVIWYYYLIVDYHRREINGEIVND
jgi:predicted MFS family arabinose efflux permease